MLKIEKVDNIVIAKFEDVEKFNALITEKVKEELVQLFEKPNTRLTLKRICIPCFVEIPTDEPEFIQLLYAATRPNQPNSISFQELIDRAVQVEGIKGANT